jgi:hypothetical protein
MKRLICWLLGHRWMMYSPTSGASEDWVFECQRCHKKEE